MSCKELHHYVESSASRPGVLVLFCVKCGDVQEIGLELHHQELQEEDEEDQEIRRMIEVRETIYNHKFWHGRAASS